jgi:cytochrome c-type biogenesis protein
MEDKLIQLLELYLPQKALWTFFIAFAGGIISSITPCTLSILPIIVGYIGGHSEDSIYKDFIQSLLFVTGFTIVLTMVGLFAALAGKIMGAFIGPLWFIILGIIAIIMGLGLLEVIYIQIPTIFKDMPKSKYGSILSPILLGLAFGTIATPCSAPILITLVSYVAYKSSLIYGTLMLAAYAFGHSILLLVCGTFTGVVKRIGHIRHWSNYITKFSGVLLILIGIYLLIYGFFPNILMP